MFNQLKKVSAFAFVAVFCLSLFSFKSIKSNERNLGGAKKVASVNNAGSSDMQAARVVRVAKKVWDASGKEAAKFVAYEIVTAGVDWLIGASDEISVASQQEIDAEAAYKLRKF